MSCRKTTASIVARLAAISVALSSTGVALGAPIVSIPEFQYEEVKKHTAAEDEEFVSSAFLSPPLRLRRAKNLLAAGHYQEAIAEYSKGASEWKVPRNFHIQVEREWGIACEKLGMNEEALQHYKTAMSKELQAKLLLKLNRFREAKRIADEIIVVCASAEKRKHEYDSQFPEWLRLRAAAEEGLNLDTRAIADLKLAGQKYFKSNSEKADLCIREANELIARRKPHAPISLKPLQLPQEGKEKIIALVKFLVDSPTPFNLAKINALTGGHLKVPGPTWPYYCEDEHTQIPFVRLKYNSEQDNYLSPTILEIVISTDKCCVEKKEIDALIPTNEKKVQPICHWNDADETKYAEAYDLSTGNLKFYFGEGGARILRGITLTAHKPLKEKSSRDYWKESLFLPDSENSKQLELLSKSIALDDRNITMYLARAKVYLKLKLFNEALVDTKHAVVLGGRPYLNEQSIVEEQMGDIDAAIEHLKMFIGNHAPGPETAKYFTRLADLYLQKKDYDATLVACKKAMIDSRETAPAMFMKAKAEKGLNRIGAARHDATIAMNDYFTQARIVRRDEVIEWLNSLPTQ
jgi:tetratricopeptide (TPR) repeat protein